MLPSVHLRDSILLTQALEMRAEEHSGRTGVGGAWSIYPSHLSAHPRALLVRCHMDSSLTKAQGRGGSAVTAVGMKRGRRETASHRHPQPLAAPWSRRRPVGCGRTRGCPLLRKDTKLGPPASPKEGLTLAEPVWDRAAGVGWCLVLAFPLHLWVTSPLHVSH